MTVGGPQQHVDAPGSHQDSQDQDQDPPQDHRDRRPQRARVGQRRLAAGGALHGRGEVQSDPGGGGGPLVGEGLGLGPSGTGGAALVPQLPVDEPRQLFGDVRLNS